MIAQEEWHRYTERLAKIDKKAAALMRDFVERNGIADTDGLIRYAYGLATKYGEASAALAAEMYDAVTLAEAAMLPAAEVAATATYGEVAEAINGVLKKSQNTEMISSSVSRLVKRAGADTTLKNAVRDEAEYAWIPSGDTCAYCINLASYGWIKASKKAVQGGHAAHIHANCDCTYAIRFSDKSSVTGYDPEQYKKMLEDAPLDGAPPLTKNRINALRREAYAENSAEINAQKRSAYEKRKERESPEAEEISV